MKWNEWRHYCFYHFNRQFRKLKWSNLYPAMHVAFLKQSHRCFSWYYMFLYCPILKELYKWKIHKIARHDDSVFLRFRVAMQVKILAISTVSHFIDWDGNYGIYVRIVWKENTEEFNATRQHIYVRLISSCVNANNRYVIMQSSHSLSLCLSFIPYDSYVCLKAVLHPSVGTHVHILLYMHDLMPTTSGK